MLATRDAVDLDVLLLAELWNARLDFEATHCPRRALTSAELAELTGASESRVLSRLLALRAIGRVFEDGVRDRWTLAGF